MPCWQRWCWWPWRAGATSPDSGGPQAAARRTPASGVTSLTKHIVGEENQRVRPANRIDGPSSRKVVVPMMKRGIHPQDFIALVAGVYAILSPLWTTTTDRASTTMVVLGVVTVVLSVIE